ncbi:aminotransferase class IV [Tessaracoccus massiliensis]|uniref:aminotransferase class IV n=1 Tax=Tessaracoccus massiliensis TaxID=1522311 RepID=UPI0006942EA5|nr:aminotransferase class IV [Tessaracoccus massiliensis]
MAIRMVALLDGTIVDPSQPIVRADDQGVVRGDGVFESLIVVDQEPRHVEEHLERLAASAGILRLPAPDAEGYRRAIRAIIEAWDWAAEDQAVVRLFMTRGPEGIDEPSGWAMAAPIDERSLRERRDGVKVLLLDRGFEGTEIVDLPWLLPGAKSLSYGINMAARRYAMNNDADDALFITPSGTLLEGPTSSLILDLDGVLTTPPLDGILRSITVAELMEKAPGAGLEVEVKPLVVDDLYRARGGWLLSSSRLVARITHADGREVPTSPLDAQICRLLGVPGAA